MRALEQPLAVIEIVFGHGREDAPAVTVGSRSALHEVYGFGGCGYVAVQYGIGLDGLRFDYGVECS